jgi:hypothetical protein
LSGLIAFGGWELAVSGASEGLDPQVARLMFDMGNMAFATAWVALGSFAVATGWAVLATRLLPPWLGWWSVVTGGCLVVARRRLDHSLLASGIQLLLGLGSSVLCAYPPVGASAVGNLHVGRMIGQVSFVD